MDDSGISVVMIGATGAVGGETLRALLAAPALTRLTLLGRREVQGVADPRVAQHIVDVLDASTYESRLAGHDVAISTLGVGEPSKMSKERFVEIDRDANVAFASACRDAGVRHFEILGSVGSDSGSMSFYLRTKGELEDALCALAFDRLSIFRPSMILTPTNRYGVSQAITLALWPGLSKLMVGGARKYRGITVARLGTAIAHNTLSDGGGVERLEWSDFNRIVGAPRAR